MAGWKQEDVFPLIAQVIRDRSDSEQRFIVHDEIVDGLLTDPTASKIIEQAQTEGDKDKTKEWLAHNMVAWFSERITVGQSNWKDAFERTKIDGKWAYKPKSNQ